MDFVSRVVPCAVDGWDIGRCKLHRGGLSVLLPVGSVCYMLQRGVLWMDGAFPAVCFRLTLTFFSS